jgi:hypothetical protein
MVEHRTEAGLKSGSARNRQPRKKPDGKGRKRTPKEQPKALFELKGTTVNDFVIGGGAVDVVLTGAGLDLEGLYVAILDAAQDVVVPGDEFIFELPQKDDKSPSEFPITVKVVAGSPGPRRIAVAFRLELMGQPVLLISALPASLVL